MKDAGTQYARIYINKDIHPAIRKESARIRAAEKRERENPENATREIVYDRKNRTLTIDG